MKQKKKEKAPSTSHAVHAIEYLKTLGIRLPKKPKWIDEEGPPELPDSLDAISNSDLTQLMSRFSAYMDYVGARLAVAEVRHRQSANKLERYTAREMVRMRGEMTRDTTITETKAIIATSDQAVEMQDKEALRDAERKLMQSVWNGADQNYKVLSRELTRRTSTFDRDD